MRCKQGDLALYVGLRPENWGQIVTCVRYIGTGLGVITGEVVDLWEIEPPLRSPHPRSMDKGRYVADKALRPIRDSDGADEMLRIAGKPTETPAQIIQEVADAARV